jgi:hypothetical protein
VPSKGKKYKNFAIRFSPQFSFNKIKKQKQNKQKSKQSIQNKTKNDSKKISFTLTNIFKI